VAPVVPELPGFHRRFDAQIQWAVSGTAMVVPEDTREFVKDDLVGLSAAVDEFRSRLDSA
jgi:hypothetical protein